MSGVLGNDSVLLIFYWVLRKIDKTLIIRTVTVTVK